MREPSANVTLAAESPVDHQDAAPQPLPGPYVTSEADSEQILTEMGPRLSGFGGKHALWLAESIHLVRSRRAEAKAGRTGAMALAN